MLTSYFPFARLQYRVAENDGLGEGAVASWLRQGAGNRVALSLLPLRTGCVTLAAYVTFLASVHRLSSGH